MFKRIDQSNRLVRLLQGFSSWLARNRGLPILWGIVLVALGFLLELIDVWVESPELTVTHIILRNVGILIALVGLLLLEPLGK